MSDLHDHVLNLVQRIETPDLICWWCGELDIDREAEHCPACERTDLTPMTAGDLLRDAMDTEYTIGSDGQFLGARILVTFGGPNIWINTRTDTVEGYWGGESCHMGYDDDLGIAEMLEEFYSCR